jgi:hypothetical protein
MAPVDLRPAAVGEGDVTDPSPLTGAPHGSPDAYREFIGEALELVRINAQQGVTYAAIGDDVGLEYATRRVVAYARAAITTLTDLRQTKNKE